MTFRLTTASLARGRALGMTSHSMAGTLTQLSERALPDTVVRLLESAPEASATVVLALHPRPDVDALREAVLRVLDRDPTFGER
jgi:sugar/nucleoside kinase (ribokinase family)